MRFKLSQLVFIYLTWSIISVFCDGSYECDLYVDSSICLRNGEKVLLPSAKRSGRILHLTFDELEPVDSSGEGNHAIGKISAHSGFGGYGASAYFRKNFIFCKSNDDFKATEFSFLFFVYLLTDEASRRNNAESVQYCPIIHKGYRNESVNEAAPELSINPLNGQIKVVVSVEGNNTLEAISNFKLHFHQWYHIAVVKDSESLSLYVNGILDFSLASKAPTRINPLPLYIGATPFTPDCDLPVLIDQVSVFKKGVGVDEIQAEASAALGGVESSYIVLGCTNCSKQEAMSACPEGYHLCNKVELYTGGYHVAKRLSLPLNSIMASASAEPRHGIGLCCADLNG